MKTTTTDPQKVMVVGAISFNTALSALQEFAAKYPIERVSRFQALAIIEAGSLLAQRLNEYEAAQAPIQKEPELPYGEFTRDILVICPADPEPHRWAMCGNSKATAYVEPHTCTVCGMTNVVDGDYHKCRPVK
jgi:hypothetical protein